MYINLGKIVVNKLERTIDDFMIFAEVIDSGMSYEHPIYVRTLDELDIWFGKSFKERDYLRDLITKGAVLYLYRPTALDTGSSDYINIGALEEYKEEVLFYDKSELPEIGEQSIKYKVIDTYYVYLAEIEAEDKWIKLSEIGNYVPRPQDLEFYPYLLPKQFATADTLPNIGDSTKKYKVLDVNRWYLWIDSSWVDERDLPQNTSIQSVSLNNRDVLALTTTRIQNLPEYFYPNFDYQSRSLGLFTAERDIGTITVVDDTAYLDNLPFDVDSDSIVGEDPIETFSYRETTLNGSSNLGKGYFRIDDLNDITKGYLVFNGYKYQNDLVEYETGKVVVPRNLFNSGSSVISLEGLNSIYKSNNVIGVIGEYNTELSDDKTELLVWSTKTFPIDHFYKFENLKIIEDSKVNNEILTQWFMEYVDVEMWSRTIGRDVDRYDTNNDISVKIENLDLYIYRITITRYDYTEVFEGSLFPEIGSGELRLDNLINRDSKLIYCKIKNNVDEIREGTFVLRGATVEDYTKEMYWNSITSMYQEEVFPDYILVPDINKYVNSLNKDYDYYIEYLDFLNLAKELNCQVLIQNKDSEYKIVEVEELPEEQESDVIYKINDVYYLNGEVCTDQRILSIAIAGNDFIFNYTKDVENRLIYFYRDFEYPAYYEGRLPGYFIFTSGLLTNIFSLVSNYILYNSPVTYPYDLPYKIEYVDELPDRVSKNIIYVVGDKYYLNGEEIKDEKLIQAVNDEKIKKSLEKYKSNYLMYNNQIYYYRDYKYGDNYESTIWVRFVVSKVSRELQKNKWKYLSLRNVGEIKKNIESVLDRILYFSVINNINITRFNPVMKNNLLELSLNVSIVDLVKENISLDVTINYNKD